MIVRLETEILSLGCVLRIIFLENRGFEVFQNFIDRESAACVAYLGADLTRWQLNFSVKIREL